MPTLKSDGGQFKLVNSLLTYLLIILCIYFKQFI
jgi:hypothetical protein